MHIHVIQLQAV